MEFSTMVLTQYPIEAGMLYRILLFLALALPQCSAPKPMEAAPDPRNTAGKPIVLTALLKLRAGDPVAFSLENTIRAEGWLKEKPDVTQARQPEEGFVLSILDETGATLALSYLAPNPLKKRLEYAEEDGTMHSTEVVQEEDWIALRVQDPGTKLTLRVAQLRAGKAVSILEIPIPQ